MVAAPWRRFAHAARWNGHAPHNTTGAANVSDSHCHESNCSAGTIANNTTGSARTVDITRRCRKAIAGSASTGRSSLVSVFAERGTLAV